LKKALDSTTQPELATVERAGEEKGKQASSCERATMCARRKKRETILSGSLPPLLATFAEVKMGAVKNRLLLLKGERRGCSRESRSRYFKEEGRTFGEAIKANLRKRKQFRVSRPHACSTQLLADTRATLTLPESGSDRKKREGGGRRIRFHSQLFLSFHSIPSMIHPPSRWPPKRRPPPPVKWRY